jgi:glycine cleavage system aminomethyltransferase T
VERVRSRAQIHRILRRVEIDSQEVPPAGAKFKVADADAGEIVSAVLSPALGKVVSMAYMRTPYSEPGTELTLGGAPARVT